MVLEAVGMIMRPPHILSSHFPHILPTPARIHAPILVTRLVDGPAQHAIVPSFDGYLYMIDGYSGCADTLDIGETSYSMVGGRRGKCTGCGGLRTIGGYTGCANIAQT